MTLSAGLRTATPAKSPTSTRWVTCCVPSDLSSKAARVCRRIVFTAGLTFSHASHHRRQGLRWLCPPAAHVRKDSRYLLTPGGASLASVSPGTGLCSFFAPLISRSCGFRHENFRRDRFDLLEQLKRKGETKVMRLATVRGLSFSADPQTRKLKSAARAQKNSAPPAAESSKIKTKPKRAPRPRPRPRKAKVTGDADGDSESEAYDPTDVSVLSHPTPMKWWGRHSPQDLH